MTAAEAKEDRKRGSNFMFVMEVRVTNSYLNTSCFGPAHFGIILGGWYHHPGSKNSSVILDYHMLV